MKTKILYIKKVKIYVSLFISCSSKNHLNRFKGWQCYNNNYEISWDGKVTNICKVKQIDLSFNPLFFKNIKNIEPMICPYKECNCDGLLKIYKHK